MLIPNGHRFLFTHSQKTTPKHLRRFLDCVLASSLLVNFNLCLVTNCYCPVIDLTLLNVESSKISKYASFV